MQKQRNVEVVKCNTEWANGGWDASEMTWKNPCTTDWMNQRNNTRWIREQTIVSMNQRGNESINPSNQIQIKSNHHSKSNQVKSINQINQSTNQSINQSVNRSINQASISNQIKSKSNQTIKQSNNQSISQSINQSIKSIKEFVNQWSTEAMNQWIDESINQGICEPMKPRSNESMKQRMSEVVSR